MVIIMIPESDQTDFQSNIGPELAGVRIIIRKGDRVLEVYDGGELLRTYSIALGRDAGANKEVEGDGRTPEGDFYIFTKNPESRFHLSLGLSYPTKPDAVRGLSAGLISMAEHDAICKAIDDGTMPPQKTRLGGEIYIHGGGTVEDWTEGCIALADADVREVFASVPTGTMVTIVK